MKGMTAVADAPSVERHLRQRHIPLSAKSPATAHDGDLQVLDVHAQGDSRLLKPWGVRPPRQPPEVTP